MAIRIEFDENYNAFKPTFVLSTRAGKKIGAIPAREIAFKDNMATYSDIFFSVLKEENGVVYPHWNKLKDFKLLWCKEWNALFEINVEVDQSNSLLKNVSAKSLGEAELSQINLYNIEINTEDDILREDYIPTVLYSTEYKSSLLDRILEKAPHYRIAHVDSWIADIQRQFSFNNKSIYDAMQEIATEIKCIFIIEACFDEYGKIDRKISVYDLESHCNSCGNRDSFVDVCPKCGSENVHHGYGKDTNIFISTKNLADDIKYSTDCDSVKNCFKLSAGDDLMTAAIINCNPNGSPYIWYISNDTKEDMSADLVAKIEEYDQKYVYYQKEHQSVIPSDLRTKYNALVDKYSVYFSHLEKLPEAIVGYPALMTAYYNTIDLFSNLNTNLMPNDSIQSTSAGEEIAKIEGLSNSSVAVQDIGKVSEATATSAVLSYVKAVVDPRYQVKISESSFVLASDNSYGTWSGTFAVTNYSDEEDTATSYSVLFNVDDNYEEFIRQKINKLLSNKTNDATDIKSLFALDADRFQDEIKKYSLSRLVAFYDASQACIDVLIEQGVANSEYWSEQTPDLYSEIYLDYYNKAEYLSVEIKLREEEIAIIAGVFDEEGNIINDGVQTVIEDIRVGIQNDLNFENFLGNDLWNEFVAYRREDTYQNKNYISDGLDNAQLLSNALDFIKTAEKEIFKSATLQHSISATVKNLLVMQEFLPIVENFEVGNWIRVEVDEQIYKLRLLSYEVRFDDLKNLIVEFSDVLSVANGVSDVESILSQAASISTSYDYVARQAKKGDKAQNTMTNILASGLNSALVQIKNNTNEDVVFNNNGLICREYDDVTDSYAPEQFRLTHNILAYTDDNWQSVCAALGKHDYTKWNGSQWETCVGYGLSAKFVNAGHIIGSQIVGGEVVSSNYSPNASGTYIDLINGSFEFAGGKIVYDAAGNALTLRDVIIAWESTNDIPMSRVNGLDQAIEDLQKITGDMDSTVGEIEEDLKDYVDQQDKSLSDTLTEAYEKYAQSKVSELDTAVGNYLGLGGGALVGDTYIVSPYIGGGYLNITSDDNSSRVIIDPNNLTGNDFIFQVHNGQIVTIGVDKNGNAAFNGDIIARSLTLESGVSIPSDNIDGLSDIATSGDYNDLKNKPFIPDSAGSLGIDVDKIMYKGDITQTVKEDSNGLTYTETTVPTSDGNIKYSTYDANEYIVFGRSQGTNVDGENYICVSKDGLLTARNALIYGTVYATDGEFAGKITAKSGKIAGWDISGNSLLREYESGDLTRNVYMQGYGDDEGIAFAVRHKTALEDSWAYDFYIRNDGYFYANNVNINGSFTTLKAGDSYFCSTYVTINAEGRGGIHIGAPVKGEWVDITVRPDIDGVGNIGDPNYQWDRIVVHGWWNQSKRDAKESIDMFDAENAYEELKNLPIYRYFYKSKSQSTQSMAIGTMIDYIPAEAMCTTANGSECYNVSSMMFWNIAASQVMQRKLEDLIVKVNELEDKIN